MDRSTINNAFRKYGTDKGARHGYDLMYSRVFDQIGDPQRLLEVGIKRGRSLAAWAELFPTAHIAGVDIADRDDLIDAAKNITRFITDSTQPGLKEIVGTDYDIVIDDGNHESDAQWATFLRLEGTWKKAYVIEDIYGIEGDAILRRRLKARGYKNITTYASALKDITIQRTKGPEVISMYAVVVMANDQN
jgi:hypothetical protein